MFSLLLISVLSTLTTFGFGANARNLLQDCTDWDSIQYSEYTYFYNNQWGSSTADSGYYQCIDVSNNQAVVTYEWWSQDGQNDNVKGYPAIVAGWNWGYKYGQGAGGLPTQVYDNKTILTNWGVSHENDGDYECYNVAFDIWFGDINDPNPSTPTTEVMIWIAHTSNDYPLGSYKTTLYNVWNTNWDLYAGSNSGGWTVYSFLNQQNTFTINNVDVNDFIYYLWHNNYIDGRQYLVGIQVGNEIIQGQGSFTHLYYDFSIN